MKHALLAALFLVPLAVTLTAKAPATASARQEAAKQQVVKLTIDDQGAYAVTPASVTKGVPVKMEVDLDKVKGCARTVVISAFGVKKTVKTDDNIIEFTPDKTGPIEIVCGMKMVKGSFTVAGAQ